MPRREARIFLSKGKVNSSFAPLCLFCTSSQLASHSRLERSFLILSSLTTLR